MTHVVTTITVTCVRNKELGAFVGVWDRERSAEGEEKEE